MPEGTNPTTGAGSNGASSGASNTGASPASGGNSNSSGKTLNIGMGPGGSSGSGSSTSNDSSSNQSGRLSADQLFKDYGEEIFKHERFTELNGYKKKYAPLDPVMKSWSNPHDLVQFDEYLGPIWRTMMGRGEVYAESTWKRLAPVFQAILDNKDINPMFAVAAANAAATMDNNGDPEDPTVKQMKEMQEKIKSFEEKDQQRDSKEEQARILERKTKVFNKYESVAQGWMDQDEIPKDEKVRKRVGDMLASNIWKHMPVGKNGLPVNALIHENVEALQKCYQEDVKPFIEVLKKMGASSLVKKAEGIDPAVPSMSGGTTVGAGPTVPATLKQKAARMAQFIQRGVGT